MKNDYFVLQYLLCAIVLSGIIGCGGSEGPQPVSGTVKFDDGEVPQGEIATITFQPVAIAADAKGASGTIEPDGTFKLTTIKNGDGALVGDYTVTLTILDAYPRGKSLVAPVFSDFRKTPLKATVEPGGGIDFDFVVKRP